MSSRSAVLALAVLTVVMLALPGAGTAQVPCDLLDPVDRLLNCDASEPDQRARTNTTTDDSGATSAQADGSLSPSSDDPQWRPLVGAQEDPTRLLVRLAGEISGAEAARIVREAGGTLERRLVRLGLAVVQADAARLDDVRRALEGSGGVRAVHSEQTLGVSAVRPNDTHWPDQTGLQLTRFPEAWQTARGSLQTVVAVVDTGVAAGHPDLGGVVLPGRDFLNGDDDAFDDHGHGTAVAGIIAASTNNAAGIAGACWLCSVLPVKVLGADGTGPTSAVAAGVLWATDQGADVINLSLGSPASTPALAEAIAYATSRGVIVVAAAGNDGVEAPFYPAAERGVIAIAAVDDQDRPYAWSNRGPWVQLAAPGCVPTLHASGGYAIECGTSMAAPVVAGLAALILGAQPTLPPAEVADVIRRSAVQVGAIVRDGRIDAARAIETLGTPEQTLATLTIRSALTRTRPRRVFSIAGEEGTWTTTLTSKQRTAFAIEVLARNGTVLTRVRARPPLRLVRRVAAGVYRIRVSGARGAFTLGVRRPMASDAVSAGMSAPIGGQVQIVRLSHIPALPRETEVQASLGRPALARDAAVFALPRITDPEAIEQELARAINDLRRSRGLNALASSRQLAAAADAHARSLALAGAFTHDWPLTPAADFGRWIQRYYPRAKTRVWRAGENLLWSSVSLSAADAVSLWQNSPSHRRVMLAAAWRELAVGVVRAEGAGGVFAGRDVYVVAAEFGAR